MTFVRKLTTDMAFYGVLDIMQRAVSFMFVPIYTRVLSQQDFGNLDLILSSCNVLSALINLHQAQGFMRFYPQYLRTGTGRRFAGTNLMTRLVLGVFFAALFLALGMGGYLEVKFLPSFHLWRASWVVAVATVPAVLIVDLLLLQTRMLRLRRLFALGALSNVVVSAIVCVILIAGLGWGLLGAIVGQGTGIVVSICILIWGLRGDIAIEWDESAVRRVLRHSLPMVPGWWLTFCSVNLSRFILYGELGAAQVAILAICMKIVNVIGLFTSSFRTAWQPLAMMNLSDKESGEQFSEAVRVFLVGGLLSLCVLAILARPLVSMLAPPSYADAARYVSFFAIASVISEIEFNLQLGNQAAGKTFWMSISATVGIVVNVAVLALLTGALGIGAVVLGALVSSVFRVAVAYTSSQANHTARYDTGAFLRFGIGCLLVGAMTAFQGRISPVFLTGSLAAIGLFLSWMSLREHEKHIVQGLVRVLWKTA